MATIEIRREHTLERAQAREVAEQLAKSLGGMGIEWEWQGESIRFQAPSGMAKGTKGVLELADQELRIDIDLPLLLRPMKGQVTGMVNAKLDKLLAAAG